MTAFSPRHHVAEYRDTDEVEIREAIETDNEALLALTKLTPMAGRISLRIDRDPDFFALSRARGESTVFVATARGDVIGCVSVSLHDAYVEGKLERIAHGNDLKVHPAFAGRRIGVRLLLAAENSLRSRGIDLSISLFAEGNDRVSRLAEGKHGQAVSLPLGKFFVDQLLPSPFRKRSGRYVIGDAGSQDLPEVAALLDESNRKKNFAPPVTLNDLEMHFESRTPGAFKKMLVARDAHHVVATLTVEDTQNLRQNLLVSVPATLRFALGLFRLAALLAPKISVPRLGRPLRILYVRFMACDDAHEAALRPLLAEARAEAYKQGFTFLSVALDERDPLRKWLTGIPKLTFTSVLIATSLITPGRAKGLIDQVAYEDFALV
jgi:ribosomal protein S18 acetylase RimI-like enzyme